MDQYESKARHHIERIRYYHENVGPDGYAQAKYDYNELAKLQMAAQCSKKNKGDAGIIAIFREQAVIERGTFMQSVLRRRLGIDGSWGIRNWNDRQLSE